MKTILVPIDFSIVSEHALKFAVDLARNMDEAGLVLLNIIIPAHTGAFAASADVSKLQGATADRFNIELMRKNEGLIEEKVESLRHEIKNIEGHVRFHEDKTDLNHFIEEFHAALVITGCENMDAFDAFLFGRKEEKIIRKTDVPVITVRKDPGDGRIKDIVMAVDIGDGDVEGLEKVKELSDSLAGTLHLVYVITDPGTGSRDAIDRLDRLAHAYELGKYTINTVNNPDVEEGILSFARKTDADMIAVFTEGRGRLHRLIFGSTSHGLVKDTDLPVLVSRLRGE